MTSPCDPQNAPVGDVATAIMIIDSRIASVHNDAPGPDPELGVLSDQFIASVSAEEADDILDGACTLIYVFMKWLRECYEDHDQEVIEAVVPHFVATMRMMPKTFPPEVIPTMAGLVIAAGNGLGPGLWRAQYGDWTAAEMTPLEATAFLLAEHINRIAGDDHTFATRMVTDALTSIEEA
ncbi:hypothetical protein [Streptomyces sp. NBC_01465]|uniref:hypothetical protein n=1 Tax=Streptomyces sp. NBC_01465 TaxID=2903878 RepID=UPI002E31B3AD|nr:hypothetical protein [Streptomyces sp. NBC_01465]